jgi:cyanate permease
LTTTQVMAGIAAAFCSLIALASAFAVIDSARKREWRFAGGALIFLALFGLQALAFWDSAVTGKRMTPDNDAPRLR